MQYYIRTVAFISFSFIVFMAAGCSSASPYTGVEYDLDRPLVKPEVVSGKPKIIAFGDSLTAGFGLSETESYPYLLQERLKADGFDYEVVNVGVSGDTSLGGLERADWVLEQENAQVLILELGANDLLRGMPVDRMKKNLASIIEKAKAKNIKVVLCGMLAPPTMGSDYERDYRNAFPDLAEEYNVTFVPFLLDGVAFKSELNQADGIHPNPEGTKIMTENIYKELRSILAN